MDSNDIPKDKTEKVEEIGVVFPDGTLVWDRDHYEFDLSGKEGREKLLENHKFNLQRANVPPVGKVIFVKRTVTTKYSKPEVFVND